jgi:hypothetical protein
MESMSNIYFRQLNNNLDLDSQNNYDGVNIGYKIDKYDDIAYLDLSTIHNPDASFTLEFEAMELDNVDTTKAVNYVTFGYHIRGRSGVAVTVGRDVGSANVVLGIITDTSTMKATTIEPTLTTLPDTKYTYTLAYNNFATNEEKLKLFRGPYLVSSSSNLDIQNFSIIDRKVFLGSSAWMNEPSWSNTFDVASNLVIADPITFQTNVAVDKSFLPGTPFYPVHYSFSNTSDTTRNTNQIAVNGDMVNIQFHSTKDVPPSSVIMSVENNSTIIDLFTVYNDTNFTGGNHLRTHATGITFEEAYAIGISFEDFYSLIYTSWDDRYYFKDNTAVLQPNMPNHTSYFLKEENPISQINVAQINVENPYILPSGSNTILYTYQLQVTDTWPIDGLLSYGLDFDGSVTLSNIFPETESNIYIDNTIPNMEFSFNNPTSSNVSFSILNITDDYYDIMTHQSKFGSFIVDFYASNDTHVKTTQVLNPELNQSYFVEDMFDETIYNLYATITDRAGNTTDRILPNNGSEIVETTDVTSPIITNLTVVTTTDINKLPGLTVAVDTYDTATELTVNEHNYTLYISVLDYAIDDIEETRSSLTTNNFYEEVKTNYNSETTTMDLYNYFDNTGTQLSIRTEVTYYVHVLVVDNASNTLVSKTSHVIDNTITFTSIVTDFTDNNVATTNNNIILSFDSTFKMFEIAQFNVTMMGDTIGNSVSTDGVSWIASNVVNNTTHPLGPVSFNVSQTNDIGATTSTFEDSDVVYIQNEPPALNVGSVSFSPGITTLTINGLGDSINDFSINSNNNLVKLTLEVDSQIIENTYNNKSEIPSTFTFTNLAESRPFEVKASISNVFSESNNIVLGTPSTLSDDPTITINAINRISDTKEPYIELLHTSTVSEKTTPYDVYMEVTDFTMPDIPFTTNFFTNTVGIVKRGENLAPGDFPTNMTSFISSSNLTTYWTVDAGSYVKKTIIPSTTTTYYVYGMIDDKTNLVMDFNAINFSYTSSATADLSNQSYPYFVRNNDTLVMSWETTFQSQISDFSNIKIYDTVATPTTADNLHWYASIDIPATGSVVKTHTLSYLDNSINVDSTNVFFDNVPPTFTMNLESKTQSTFVMSVVNVADTLYTNAPVPTGIDNTFTIAFIVSDVVDGGSYTETYTTENLSFLNISTNTYVLDNLAEAQGYTISCTLTDPANNVTTLLFNGGGIVKTTDSTNPNITNTANGVIDRNTESIHLPETNFVTLSNIQAHDVHGYYNVYVGLFATDTITFDLQMLKDNSNTTAVIYSQSNAPAPNYVAFDGIFENVLSETTPGTFTSIPFEYERDYYVYIGIDDDSGNININGGLKYHTVSMMDGPTDDAFEYPTAIDPLNNLSASTTNSIVFQPILEGDELTEADYVGYDVSGNNDHIFINTIEGVNPLSTNTAVNDYSLALGLTNGVNLSSKLPASFTYSTFVNNTNDEYNDTVLLKNGTNDFITVSESGITVNSGTSIFFPVTMDTNSWDNVTVSVDGTTVRVFVNGVEILPTGSSVGFVTPLSGSLSIPSQENILIDGITIYDIPVNAEILETIVNSGNFVIHLDFEEGSIVQYEVSFSNNMFLINGEVAPELTLNSNNYYTFNNYKTDVPFLISQDGTFPVSDANPVNVSYFINNVNIGNDPLRYSVEFRNNDNNKVVVLADSVTPYYYHSTDSEVLPVTINVEQTGRVLVKNKANDANNAQPMYSMVPSFSTNTTLGDYAMVFDSSKQMSFDFNNFQIDANQLTMSAWVNTDFTKQSENPLISQEGIFEFGIDSSGNTYLKLLNNDTPASFIDTIDLVSMDDKQVSVSNIQLVTPVTNPTYMYAMATTNKRDKAVIMNMMDTHRDSSDMFFQTITTETSIASIDLGRVFDTTDNAFDMNKVNQAYVYLSAREGPNAYTLGDANEYYEYKVSYSNTVPRAQLNGFSNIDIDGTQSITIEDATVFGSTAPIDKYYSFAFLQNDDGTVGSASNESTDDLVNTFIESISFVNDFDSLVSGGAIYFNDTDVPKNTVRTITNATTSKAFNSLTDSTDVSVVNADGKYITHLVFVDSFNNLYLNTMKSIPKAKHWRMAFLGWDTDRTRSWQGTNPTQYGAGGAEGSSESAPYTHSHGWYTFANEWLMRTTLTDNLVSRPSPIDASKIASVIINNGQSNRLWQSTSGGTFTDVFTQAITDYLLLHIMETEGVNTDLLTVNGQYYNRAAIFDIEFVNEETIMEFIWNGHPGRATNPYIIKIDYSQDGVTYNTDTMYVRDEAQSDYPVLREFQNTSDHMVLQRSNGTQWSDAVSMVLN